MTALNRLRSVQARAHVIADRLHKLSEIVINLFAEILALRASVADFRSEVSSAIDTAAKPAPASSSVVEDADGKEMAE